jgi:hypothetical protein
VQERVYHEATLLLRVLDGREAPLAELVGDHEAQLALAEQIAMYLGESRSDRLVMRECKRVTVTCSYSSGDVDEPATELLFAVRRELPGSSEREPTLVMQSLTTARDSGHLAEQMGVSRDNIRTFEVELAREVVRDAQTLVQLRSEAASLQEKSKARYEHSLTMKGEHKAVLRQWHRLKGALLHLRRLDASQVLSAAKAKKHAVMDADGSASAEADAALGRTEDGETTPEFLNKWMGVKDILRSKLAVLAAMSEKDVRTRMRNDLVRAEGRLQLLDRLMSGCMEWPEVVVRLREDGNKEASV